MKTCKKCGHTKPTTEFSKNSTMRDKLSGICNLCAKIATAKWRVENPEKRKVSDAKRYLLNPDKQKAATAKWISENREKANAAVAKWRMENKEACCIHSQNRRARKREAGGKLSKGLSGRLFKLQRGRCACGCKLPLGDDYHRDHIIPLFLGGSNTDDNIQLLRATCNMQKNKKHPVDYMQSKGFLI